MPSVATDVGRLTGDVDALLALLKDVETLDYRYQKIVAETIVLRLFYGLDAAVEGIALKLARGVPYVDGSKPILLCAPFKSIAAAETAILGSKKSGAVYLKWTTLVDIQKNLKLILDPTDHFIIHRVSHDSTYEAMRHIRNHIAHSTKSTARRYHAVISQLYGGPRKGISPGKLLLSQRAAIPGVGVPTNRQVVEQYLSWSKTFIKTLAKQ